MPVLALVLVVVLVLSGNGSGTGLPVPLQCLSVAMMRSMSGSNEWERRSAGITNTFYPDETDENEERV